MYFQCAEVAPSRSCVIEKLGWGEDIFTPVISDSTECDLDIIYLEGGKEEACGWREWKWKWYICVEWKSNLQPSLTESEQWKKPGLAWHWHSVIYSERPQHDKTHSAQWQQRIKASALSYCYVARNSSYLVLFGLHQYRATYYLQPSSLPPTTKLLRE